MYNYNHSHKITSWRTFQQTLQREARQNSPKNIKVTRDILPKQKISSAPMKGGNPPSQNGGTLQQKMPLNRSTLIKKSPSFRSSEQPVKKSSPLKKVLLSLSIIIATTFTIQQTLPIFMNGAQSLFTEASAFFKHDAASFVQQLASSIKTKSANTNLHNDKQPKNNSGYLSKQELKAILEPHTLLNLSDNKFTISNTQTATTGNNINTANNQGKSNQSNSNLVVTTTLDMRLQNFILEQIDSLLLLDRGKPEIIAMVAMEPHTGKILAMAGFDSHSPDTNPCTDGAYPAASLFKLVTASAAVETCGYSPATTMYFSGGKYTLYKHQLSEGTNIKYLNKVTLAEALAQSINPVFGKLGSIILGKDVLQKYANSFGFNQEIDSEISFTPGTCTITENSYQCAEVASGFNKSTTISPIFGAMIASTMLNSGKTPVPSIVESVKDDKGKLIYKRKEEILYNTVKPDTAKTMMKMMNGTIITGTARKSFRGFDKDNVLSRLNMGGKTGSLSSYDRSVKFDWFSGFCTDSAEQQQIVVSVLVGHGKYIGTKASIYGRLMFKEYFNNYFALNSQKSING